MQLLDMTCSMMQLCKNTRFKFMTAPSLSIVHIR